MPLNYIEIYIELQCHLKFHDIFDFIVGSWIRHLPISGSSFSFEIIIHANSHIIRYHDIRLGMCYIVTWYYRKIDLRCKVSIYVQIYMR